jgi:hypothetical protein
MKKLSTFDGHIVLWCKGHYSANDDVSMFDEIKRIWAIRCGLDFEHVDNYSYEYIANRLYKILAACEPHKEKYLHELIHKSLTSSIGYPEGLSYIEKLIYFYRSEIMSLQVFDINDDSGEKITLIDLPEAQPEIFKRITNGLGEFKDYDLIIKLDERKLSDCLVD